MPDSPQPAKENSMPLTDVIQAQSAVAQTAAHRPRPRAATQRHLLMCRPIHFDVTYSINPWMHPGKAVDGSLALSQWEELRNLYRELGHTVEEIDPLPG